MRRSRWIQTSVAIVFVGLAGLFILISSQQPASGEPDHRIVEEASATDESSGDTVLAPVLMFDTVEEAQAVAPFDISPPKLPEQFSIDVIQVLGVNKENVDDSQVIVDIVYVDPTGMAVRYAVGNRPITSWSKDGDPQFTQEREEWIVNDKDVLGITARSENLVLGYLYWKSGEQTYQLWYPGKTASDLKSFVQP